MVWMGPKIRVILLFPKRTSDGGLPTAKAAPMKDPYQRECVCFYQVELHIWEALGP